MECHVEDDYLLIWYDKEENIIKLVRLGSHSDCLERERSDNEPILRDMLCALVGWGFKIRIITLYL